MFYLRYSLFDTSENVQIAVDLPKLKRFQTLDEAKDYVEGREENGRFLLYDGTIFRKEKGREVHLIGYSRDENNDLISKSLV